jgi:hypothetical protein
MLAAAPAPAGDWHPPSLEESTRQSPSPRTQTAWENPCTVWPDSALPAGWYNDGKALEVGFRFRTEVPGQVTAIRFHKGAGNHGPHVGHLWTNEGSLIAEVPFRHESASGWQVAKLASPIALVEGTTYVASVHCADGFFPFTAGYFLREVVNGPLRALASGEDSPNGIFSYSAVTAFPTRTFRDANYWVDVVFRYPADAAVRAHLARGPCEWRESRHRGVIGQRPAGWYPRRIRELEDRLRRLEAEVDELLRELGDGGADPSDSEESGDDAPR